ncbi:MAG: PBP1A family penicillin-binding protein [Bdellovibrionales bacterium]|nr:PBP1A family penicillin-binding protein [Bdellovibrionales bacterium]
MGVWLIQLNSDIQERLKKGWFLPPVEIYSAPQRLVKAKQLNFKSFANYAKAQRLRERDGDQKILDGDWSVISRMECEKYFAELPDPDFSTCFIVDLPDTSEKKIAPAIALLSENNTILGLYNLADGLPVSELQLKAYKFAQYYDDKPILRRLIEVSETPLYCLQAITAIEDPKFLEHKGVSITGTLRALYRNLVAGRYAQGGSTITQQLVKNYFLSSEKTLKRKIKEQFMAVLLELQSDKDTILENYLNVIYMGANGPFQVRGFGAASEHYFQTPIENLELHECALLAAIVNSPGRYNPFRKQENATKRRKRVLDKMVENGMLDPEAAEVANSKPLPNKSSPVMSEPAPYFVHAVLRKLKTLQIGSEEGLKIFTTLDLRAQEIAQTVLAQKTKGIESWFKHLKDIREKQKKYLQSSLISVDLKSGEVMALVGGRSFKNTQYNRILDAKRQVGSTMKPFVFLAALESYNEEGVPYSATTPLIDERFTHEYEGQSWSPKNYGDEYYGQVPMYFALKNSLNTATAKLGLSVGLEAVVEVAKRFGIESQLKALPSITLGAFEITPWELARAYTAVGRQGDLTALRLLDRVEDSNGNLLYKSEKSSERVASKESTAVLTSMMRQTLRTGTAKASAKMGVNFSAAGKTGTTSDSKDAWFVGFTPEVLTIVWVGYDDNTSHGLTGASGALPIWSAYMTQLLKGQDPVEFAWPEGTYPTQMTSVELTPLFDTYFDFEHPIELLFRSQDQ